MPIVSVRDNGDNENNRWKRNSKKKKKKTKPEKNKGGGAEAIVKGWELNGLVVHLS